MSKVRFVKLVVVPYAVLDDGTNLHELDIKPLEVPSHEIDGFVKSGLASAIEALSKAYEDR
jgi:hypothetical protein